MLESLHVKNLALIDECSIDFTNGLNILTGETGAGKSIIIGSVNLALGAKADKEIIRTGQEYGLVELSFSGNRKAETILHQMDLPLSDDGSILISRKIMPTKSVFKINGETVISRQVKELAEQLIDIHGQHEHQSLLDGNKQRGILDEFGGEQIRQLRDRVKNCYETYRQRKAELNELLPAEKSSEREQDLIEFELNEISDANLSPGEDDELEEKYRIMINSRKICEAVIEALELVSSENAENASDMISRAVQKMNQASAYDESAAKIALTLSSVEELLGDFAMAASAYVDRVEYEPQELADCENRLNLINHLKAKFGATIDQIFQYRDEQEKRLDQLKNYDQYKTKLEEELSEAVREYQIASNNLYESRKKNANEFEEKLKVALEGLNFIGVTFKIDIQHNEETFTENGSDTLEFMISMNPGEPVKPLRNVASGGELSRIMLAIKTMLASKDDIDSLIFDEIDAGISGKTAWEVAKRLGILSSEHQVLCITHLPQIASMAKTHFCIEKVVESGKTHTLIEQIDEEGMIQELARLLGGTENSTAAYQNAREMKQLAQKICLNN